ncbi:hypothetical protein EGW08_001214, partial [Elysia chlorotica]
MASTPNFSEKEHLTSPSATENGSFSESPPQEISPEEEDTKLLLEKDVTNDKSSGDGPEEIQAGTSKTSARSSLISFAAAPGKSKLFDKSLGDKSIKHSILKDSCDEESPPSTAKKKDDKVEKNFADLKIVSAKASQFGFGSSTPDSYSTLDLEDKSTTDDKSQDEPGLTAVQVKEDDPKEKNSKGTGKKVEKSPKPEKTQKADKSPKPDKTQKAEKSPKPEKFKPSRSSANQESVSLETSGSTALFSSTSSSRYNTGDKSAEASLLQSPQRSEGSSEYDSPFLNTSEEADSFLSPSHAS